MADHPIRVSWSTAGRLTVAITVVVLALWTPTRPHELPPESAWKRLEDAAVADRDSLASLEGERIVLTGFMMPLGPGVMQRHYLLSAYPLSCGYCVAGGPGSLVEVFAREPVGYTDRQLRVEGRFRLHPRPAEGLFYQLFEAAAMPFP